MGAWYTAFNLCLLNFLVYAERSKMVIAPKWICAKKGVKSMGNTGLPNKHTTSCRYLEVIA